MTGKNLTQYVTFKIGKETYAMNIEHVESIVSNKEIRPIPNTRVEVKGIANIQEDIVPIIDLRVKFSLKSEKILEVPFIIVSRMLDVVVGLVVDEVNEVLTITPEEIHLGSITSKTIGDASEYIFGVHKKPIITEDGGEKDHQDRDTKYELIILLNTNKLLGFETMEDIERVKEQYNEGV